MRSEADLELDRLPTFCRTRVLILGVGNVLFGDDGFGPAVIEHLAGHFAIPEDACALDVGTGARKVLFTISLSETRPREILVVDAVDWGYRIGEVLEIPVESLPVSKTDDFSLHQVPTSNLLRELQDTCGVKITVIACDVGEIEQAIEPGLSSPVQRAVTDAAQKIATRYELRPNCNGE